MREPLFWGPILITYITNIGKMTLPEMYFMESIVVFGMIFVEIYSSAWADLLGRKKTVVLGSFLTLISIILFSLASSPMLIWVANIFIMIGFAIISGTDEAFLVDGLKENGRFDEFTRINGRIMSRRFILIAITSILSGYLYNINPRLPMFLSIPGVLVSLLIAFFFEESKRMQKASHKEHFELMKISVLFVANHKKVKWIIGYIALITVASKLWFFTYNPYFELVEIDPKYFGWIFFVLNIVAWISSKYAYKVEQKMSELAVIIILIALIGIPLILMGTFVSYLAIGFIFLENFTRGFREPFFSSFINKHLDSKNRATVLSIKAAARAFIHSICLFLFGLVLARWQLFESLQVLGIVVLALGVISVWKYKKLFKNN
ncbi:hypothetical protein A2331_04260 [Candidatus Falkowbacteria bacterium RIFOXYB2_FULL_34_18]|uniref:Major facilitator superfamily (MFS) profile domain-containing protein n=1 Tax=Candidatus Falkowbacteria bacterium RIFOXYD2_FULL_34_120 TaxID=1798007 RepID=A0A1F5TPJ1_9BACT|nr:MAG: hypothetical protein A2500_04610 [Candidatus Falkowbacteria bacterium RIFOXYC12_FULL_34_55]OGF28881.1 MAG: hypothetical protein A2331_04260 [Candidatus Falkowbacteria bacterium RIFOXYB2_FULL_34_18]OGF35647.1 MAG: hypothetical protein A2466_04615 [Candidatus Falkowbacteria bacterium RIFOXYC2_FULL_34_220]OGF38393.1 MAG: hypothetical protein A2515_02920 [Candidatus Falkowbacteria bacterium RIFOXYD12_FULL_34_57]OGF40441.1 MAG: hypothetical protein A2531_02805 [Candidatus Falkowbacteria bact